MDQLKQKKLVVPRETRRVTDHNNSQENATAREEARNCGCNKVEAGSGIVVFAWRSCADSRGQIMLTHRHDYWNCRSTTHQKHNGTMEESAAQT